ncbi:hypothetical protein EJ04DRAFT_498980 [Polyplosphaeria fusca]|uniref:Uncharacterized protein n=1 Tax=Polyplosphaeria fusca TaxID=682080 RepID=A0A9P4QRR8_9PLEO|nr:hypothetical protein EJ04DRAFT_498980 [Polyplosphaeria fusca]
MGLTNNKKPNGVVKDKRAKAVSPLLEEDYVGKWLCEKGPYQEYIKALSGSNPGLMQPDPANKKIPLINGLATVVLLEAGSTGKTSFTPHSFRSASKLKEHFDKTDDKHNSRRVYIMEGLAPDYVAVIGGHFFMDPTFFQRQERSCVWSNDFTPTSDALPQPSLLDPDKMYQIQYCELRQFTEEMENAPYFCARTGRHVGMTKARASQAEITTTGILRRKAGFWCRETSRGGWDAVILCDPQLHDVLKSGTQVSPRPISEPFQKGYIDFLPPASYRDMMKRPAHPHTSMLVDLQHYFINHANALDTPAASSPNSPTSPSIPTVLTSSPPRPDWTRPQTASIFLKKIVAAHYLQLADYIKAMLPSLELQFETAWKDEQDQWKSLQTISRRCGNYCDDMEDSLLSLGYSLKGPEGTHVRDWRDVEKDFQYIYYRLGVLKSRADTLMQAMTGLASIAGNRQNLEEAKRVKRLNLLALLFIPLAYTSSLFSMQDSYAPGAKQFWVYWVCGIGAAAFTFALTWLLGSALDDAARWTLGPWKLFFWNKSRRIKKVKRVRTIYGGSKK